MKKIIYLLVVVLGLSSCTDDLVFNTPAFLGYNNSELWEANSFRANVDTSGHLIITGIRNESIINLKTDNTIEGTYELGNTVSSAVYQNDFGVVYTTNNIPNPEVQIYPSEGQIVITEFNLIERTVSGTFTFNGFDSTGFASENFNRGYFYNVPILNIAVVNPIDVDLACQNATAVALTTETNLGNVDPAGVQYTDFCNAYKTALQVKKASCGDTDGAIQALIDGLGDCSN